MLKHYKDYYWLKGKPEGLSPLDDISKGDSYKIIVDPYFKYYSIEKYSCGIFVDVVYDSKLLDFRHLKPMDQMAWQKENVAEDKSQITSLIRNMDDRVIYKEVYTFDKQTCRECRTYSPHGLLLSIQKLFYKEFSDPFNGVILFDTNNHAVMSKRYEVDAENSFTELLEECWDTRALSLTT